MGARFALGLENKVVLVTGAGRNLGREIALSFAREGAITYIVDITQGDLEETAAVISKAGGQAVIAQADVTSEEQVQKLAKNIREKHGSLDILVNNATIRVIKPFLEHTMAEWNQVMSVNLSAVFLCCQAFGQDMVKQRKGSVINVASRTGYRGHPGRVAYCTSKGGVIQFTRALALEWAEYGVTVNSIAPGLINLPTAAKAVADGKTKEIPLGRMAEKEEVASLILYLACPNASYITGAVFPIDGGWSAK